MSITDFVWIAIGETLLAATFALGILVGVSLAKKGQRNDYGNSNSAAKDYWHDSRQVGTSSCLNNGRCGRSKDGREANSAERVAARRDADRDGP
jgi:hypothetical protein